MLPESPESIRAAAKNFRYVVVAVQLFQIIESDIDLATKEARLDSAEIDPIDALRQIIIFGTELGLDVPSLYSSEHGEDLMSPFVIEVRDALCDVFKKQLQDFALPSVEKFVAPLEAKCKADAPENQDALEALEEFRMVAYLLENEGLLDDGLSINDLVMHARVGLYVVAPDDPRFLLVDGAAALATNILRDLLIRGVEKRGGFEQHLSGLEMLGVDASEDTDTFGV